MRGKIKDWWRGERGQKWAGELANIVLGVLIALALGAVATWIGWKIDVADARQSIGEELGEIAGQGRLRERTYECSERKLDQIAAILDAAEKSGRLPAVGRIGEPAYFTWSRGVWDSTVGSDTASHFDRDELDNLSGVYEYVDIIRSRTQAELDAWTQLYALVGPGREIAPAEVTTLRSALTQARQTNRQITVGAIRAGQTINAFELPANRHTIEQYGDAPIGRYCGPIAHPDGKPYGQAPQEGAIQRAHDNPITREEIGITSR